MKNKNSLVLVFVILSLAILFGAAIFYVLKLKPPGLLSEPVPVTNSVDLKVIENELKETQVGSPEKDIKDLETSAGGL